MSEREAVIIVTIALLVPALAPGVPGIFGEIAETYWPTSAGQTSYTTTGTGPLHPLAGLAVMAIFTLWTTPAGHLTLKTRDV